MGIRRSQLVNMNQHYRRFSLDYFLDCQQRLGIRQIELWCGVSHFWLDHEGTGDVPALKQKLLDHDVRVVSVTAPSIAYQYQYASQEPELLEYSFRYFSNAIRLAAAAAPAQVSLLGGGIQAWKAAGLPVEEDKSQPLPLMRQVQIAAGVLILLGVLLGYTVNGGFFLLSGAVGAGLTFAGVTGFCGMARLLAIMPWNRRQGS